MVIQKFFKDLCPDPPSTTKLAKYLSENNGQKVNNVYQRLRKRSNNPVLPIIQLEQDLELMGYKIEITPK